MKSRPGALLAAGGTAVLTAALALALAAPPTLATAIDSTYTAVPGGVSFALAHHPSFLDSKTGTVITCNASKFGVTLPADGIPHAGSGFGTVTQFGFSTCFIGDVTFSATGNHVPWSLNIASFNTGNDVVHGSITGMDITLSGANGCSADVDGTAAGADNGYVKWSYSDNQPPKLTVSKTNGSLFLYNVQNCAPYLSDNDPVVFEAGYNVGPKQHIT